jgi:hypothetical protein
LKIHNLVTLKIRRIGLVFVRSFVDWPTVAKPAAFPFLRPVWSFGLAHSCLFSKKTCKKGCSAVGGRGGALLVRDAVRLPLIPSQGSSHRYHQHGKGVYWYSRSTFLGTQRSHSRDWRMILSGMWFRHFDGMFLRPPLLSKSVGCCSVAQVSAPLRIQQSSFWFLL